MSGYGLGGVVRAAGLKTAPVGQVGADLLLVHTDGSEQPATDARGYTRAKAGVMPANQRGEKLGEQDHTQQQAVTVERLTKTAAALQQARVARATTPTTTTTTTTTAAAVTPVGIATIGVTASSSPTPPAPTTHPPDATEDHGADRSARRCIFPP